MWFATVGDTISVREDDKTCYWRLAGRQALQVVDKALGCSLKAWLKSSVGNVGNTCCDGIITTYWLVRKLHSVGTQR